MADDESEYRIGKEENTFIRTAVLEFSLIQALRSVLLNIPENKDREVYLKNLREEASRFNKSLNERGDPQSQAWEKAMTRAFERIYDAASTAVHSQEERP